MEIASSIGQLYDATLVASYRGVRVRVLDSSDEVGRRIIRVIFPGQDLARFYDLGQDDGHIKLTLLLIGDDHLHQAERLRTAIQTAGVATLRHPWLGSLQVVPAERARFTDAVDKILCTKVELTVWRYKPRQAPPTGTLQGLLDRISDLRDQALDYLHDALGPVMQGLAVLGYVGAFAGQLGAAFDTLVGATPTTGPIANAAAAPIAALDTIGSIPPGSTYGDQVGAALAAPSAAIAATSFPVLPAAIGPGDAATLPTAIDARVTAGLLLAVLPAVAAAAAAASPAVAGGTNAGAALSAGTQALICADLVQAASDIDWDSATEAASWRDQVSATLDGAADAACAAPALSGGAQAAGGLWQAVTDLQAAWHADMTATVGRLPPVVTLTLPQASNVAWLVAQFLAGDQPGDLVATLQDVLRRNGVRRPWAVPQQIEVLQP